MSKLVVWLNIQIRGSVARSSWQRREGRMPWVARVAVDHIQPNRSYNCMLIACRDDPTRAPSNHVRFTAVAMVPEDTPAQKAREVGQRV